MCFISGFLQRADAKPSGPSMRVSLASEAGREHFESGIQSLCQPGGTQRKVLIPGLNLAVCEMDSKQSLEPFPHLGAWS